MKTVSGGKRLLLFLLVFLPLAFLGERNSVEGKEVLGLDQMIQMALEKSPELKEADQDILSAQSDLAQAKAGRWPQLDMTGVIGPVEDAEEPIVRVNPKTFIGRIENRDEGDIGIFGRLDFTLSQPIYTFGKISNRKKAAEFGVAVQRAAKDKKHNEIVLNVKQLYYALIVAQQGKSAARDADRFYEDARTRIERLLKAGAKNVDQSDLYRLEAFQAEVEQFKVKAESGAQMAYLALKKTIGYPAEKDFELDTQELPKDTRALGSQEEYISKALEERPEFEQLRSGIEAQKSLYEASKSDLYPSIFAAGIGSFAGAPGREDLDSLYFDDEFNHAFVGIVLGTEWHFDFGIGTGKVNKEKAAYQKLLHTKEFAERSIPLEVAKYYNDAVEYQASFQAYEKAASAARKWIVTSFSNFDFGLGTARDMLDAIERYGKNQGEYLRALYEYHIALANLSYAVGEHKDQTDQKPR